YFYSGPKAEDVIKSYQQTTIGLPAMQQYWTLGYHQCRWGYESWAVLQDVVDNFAKFEIPLETIWGRCQTLSAVLRIGEGSNSELTYGSRHRLHEKIPRFRKRSRTVQLRGRGPVPSQTSRQSPTL